MSCSVEATINLVFNCLNEFNTTGLLLLYLNKNIFTGTKSIEQISSM